MKSSTSEKKKCLQLALYSLLYVYFLSGPIKAVQEYITMIKEDTLNTTMNIRQAGQRLFDQTPLAGRARRRRAKELLLESNLPEAAVVLAEAVVKQHPDSMEFMSRLLLLPPGTAMHTAVWAFWKQEHYSTLVHFCNRSEHIQTLLISALESMEKDDRGCMNIFNLWQLLDDPAIAGIITSGDLEAPSLELDTLFGLAEGRPERYLSLDDHDCSILYKALITASPAQKQRINTTVLKSCNPVLVKAYDRAGGEWHDPELVVSALMAAGDEDGLFEQLHGMPFAQALRLVARWHETGRRPSEPDRRRTVEMATDYYDTIPPLPFSENSGAPEGTIDALLHWHERDIPQELLDQELLSPDPFIRAGALYMAAHRGQLTHRELLRQAESGTWVEQLSARLMLHSMNQALPREHVCWLHADPGTEARLLSTILPGTIDDSQYFLDRLEELDGLKDSYTQQLKALLNIMTLLQGHFLSGIITVNDHDSTPHPTAIETENAPEAEWHR
ncbi:hypothetical protein [Prosthecochloris sp. HL-130-GSB]|uniref:hypothetical protein n=1 Tax=Prosthecochloris sp. HL-130-GSB TaxID=1974213 RepID=UPI000A1C0C98|nr:hypothetical protein [Prosthecochloris sp. HL-130-GSB]ARM31690.1 hypothetical protein B9H02_10765 [Prosthecochloris sp. HL-130-GSB]